MLWGSLTAGASGVEWYFGYKLPNNDLNAEDWRSRSKLWKLTDAAIHAAERLPLDRMRSSDESVREGKAWVLSGGGHALVYRFEDQGDAELAIALADGTDARTRWISPTGDVVDGPDVKIQDGVWRVPPPPSDVDGQWAVVISPAK